MREALTFVLAATIPVQYIVIAGLVVAAVILVGALLLFRSSGKKKAAKGANIVGTSGWQPEQQQGGVGGMNPQQQGGWGMQSGPGGAQQQGGWGMQSTPGGAQQQAGAWNPTMPAQQPDWAAQNQQQAGAWNPTMPAQQPDWAAQGQQQQQPAAWNPTMPAQQPDWAAQGQQQQQPAAWNPTMPAQQPDPWATQGQQQQPAAWNPGAAAQQPDWAAQGQQQGNWNSQQPAANAWGGAGVPSAGIGGQPSWNSAPAALPDSWQQNPQQNVPAWNAPAQAQQQPSTGYGANSGPSWEQTPPIAGSWASPTAQPFQQIPSTPAGANPAASAWQPGGLGSSGGFDNDKTIMRSAGSLGGGAMPGASAPGRMGMVRVEEGKEPGRVYEMRKDALSIGRSRESDIFLEDLAVSRLHASVVSLGSGNFALKDEGSANGTKVNGQLVSKYQTYPLQEGDRIQLGQTVLVFARK